VASSTKTESSNGISSNYHKSKLATESVA